MSLHDSLTKYMGSISTTLFAAELGKNGGFITFSNSGKRGEIKSFTISLYAFLSAFNDIKNDIGKFVSHTNYIETEWRDFSADFNDLTVKSTITVQTKSLFVTMSKLVAWANDRAPDKFNDQTIEITSESIAKTIEKISQLMGCYSVQKDKLVTPQLISEVALKEFLAKSHFDFTQAGLRVSDSLLLRFGASLLAKRFLILTGLSGSGKTKLAHAFASWLTESEDQYRLVAVGADWTTNESVIGYQDALQPSLYRKPSNGLLEVILRAAADADRPYFLILDEMNLSHVERYFADILSAIESRQEIALHASAESLKSCENDTLLVPSKISLPKNLFIIGTVNVDETTYMFSPKVLDRANVIEFRATAEDISAFLDNPSAVDMDILAGKGAAFGAAFVAEAATEVRLNAATAAELKARLTEVFAELKHIGAEFGFRTAYEISRFIHFHDKLTGEGWQFNDALDAQVLQKLMPKLHGSQRRLEPVLKALAIFCESHQCHASLEKIGRMQDRLKDGFTSFAEA